MNDKLKSFLLNDQLFYGFIVILVALVSFGLGRVSVVKSEENTIKNEVFKGFGEPKEAIIDSGSQLPEDTSAILSPVTDKLVASKSGTKYHLIHCPGAKQIKEENKVYFSTEAEALAAGYKPAANCPELQ